MLRFFLNAGVGLALLVLAAGWSVAAPWLSANKLITVWTELSSYWLCLAGVIWGAVAYALNRSESKTWLSTETRCVVGVCAFVVVLALSLSSNRVFLFWKLRTIPASAWPEMIADLEKVGTLSAESGTNYLSGAKAPPKSLQQLGLGNDYAGGSAHIASFPNYSGVIADIEFGNKIRVWGLHFGPEKALSEFCPNCRGVRVGPNALFYMGSRG
jgi:hypothetical protein